MQRATEDEWDSQFQTWEAADAAQARAADASAAVQPLDLRRPDSRSSSAKRANESVGDGCAQIEAGSKRARRAAHHSQRPAAVPCELEQHELRIGELCVTLQRRVPGVAATKNQESQTAHEGSARAADESLDNSIDTTGLDLWTPAVRLCVSFLRSSCGRRLMASHSSLRVLELGAGLGAAGLLVAQCLGSQASSLCLTDGAECVLPLLRHNAGLNPLQSGACIFTRQLRFGHDDDGRAVLAETCDTADRLCSGDPLLVIGCEVLFGGTLVLPLLRTLRQLLCQPDQRRSSIALLSHTVRRSIFAGPDGQLMREPTDTVLDTFLQAAAHPVGIDGHTHGDDWTAGKLDVRLLASTHESGDAATGAADMRQQSEQESLEDRGEQEDEEEVRLYAVVASAHQDT